MARSAQNPTRCPLIESSRRVEEIERGWTPATMLMDVEQDFPDGANPPYRPVNYDGKFVGPISLRAALASGAYKVDLGAVADGIIRFGGQDLG